MSTTVTTTTTIIIMADHYYTPDVISKLRMRKLKHWEYKSFVQGPTARKEQTIDLDPGLSVPKF